MITPKTQTAKIFAVLIFILIFSSHSESQLQIKKLLKSKIKAPDLSSLFQNDPPITTSLQGARFEVPFLDGYVPQLFLAAGIMPMDRNGAFLLVPGAYVFDAQSYCLRAGTHSPGKGDGYIVAPLEGEAADIIKNILQRSVRFPEMPQTRIQLLIWAIIARSKMEKLSSELQSAANALLTEEQLKRLRKSELDYIQDMAQDKFYSRLSPVFREIYLAENRIRQIMSQTEASYEQVEKVAVLAGAPSSDREDRNVPYGRWSYHATGYFIRFFPRGYTHTRIEISVPGLSQVSRDAQGRISGLTGAGGKKIAIDYMDDGGMPLPGDPAVSAQSIRAIRYFVPAKPSSGGQLREWTVDAPGWTFTGTPGGQGRPGSSPKYKGLNERYKTSIGHLQWVRSIMENVWKFDGSRFPMDQASLDVLVGLYHLKAALQSDEGSLKVADECCESDVPGLISEAWQSVFQSVISGQKLLVAHARTQPGRISATIDWAALDPAFDPSGTVAVPGQTGRQRLGLSCRCYPDVSQDSREKIGPITEEIKEEIKDIDPNEIYVYENNGLTCFVVRLDEDGNPLPTQPCLEQIIQKGMVPEGSLSAAASLLMGCIQQAGQRTRITVRIVDVETGEVQETGMGEADGTDEEAIDEAMDEALENLGPFNS